MLIPTELFRDDMPLDVTVEIVDYHTAVRVHARSKYIAVKPTAFHLGIIYNSSQELARRGVGLLWSSGGRSDSMRVTTLILAGVIPDA